MSLFPAYGNTAADVHSSPESWYNEGEGEGTAVSPGREAQLLAEPVPPAPPAPAARPVSQQEFFMDRSMERTNLHLSTLYFPARPQYTSGCGRTVGVRRTGERKKVRRYYSRPAALPDNAAEDAAARAADYRRALVDEPHDEDLWLRYLDFLEQCASCGAVTEDEVTAAERAAVRLPRSWRIRARLHAALRRALSPNDLARRLADDLARAPNSPATYARRLETWARVVCGAAVAGGADVARAVHSAAAAAVADTRHCGRAYPQLLHLYGSFLRAAGLWEQLVLLIELVVAMNFPPAGFPPPRDLEQEAAAEKQLREYEDKVIASGLPVLEVWCRVERARDALQWRAPATALPDAELAADPGRAPAAHEAAELLRPTSRPAELLAALIRATGVPLLPSAQYVQRSACPARGDVGTAWDATDAGALAALVRAARRLPPAHPARVALSAPGAARRLLALAPHRLFTADDSTGFTEWSEALWMAALRCTAGRARAALLCWRLRFAHAQLLMLDTTTDTGANAARRLRVAARAALKCAPECVAAFACWARLEQDRARARTAALTALRRAVDDADTPHCDALYAARVVCEIWSAGESSADSPYAPQWAVCCAALRTALPNAHGMAQPPPPHLVAQALNTCEERCAEIERTLSSGQCAWAHHELCALLPAPAEWAAARAHLAPPTRREQLLAEVVNARAPGYDQETDEDEESLPAALQRERWREQAACALAAAAAREQRATRVARSLARAFPLNGYLALLSSGAPLWAGVQAEPRGDTAALAALLPHLLRAAALDWPPEEAGRVSRVAARLAGAGGGAAGGALLRALRGEAAGRAGGPTQAQHAFLQALNAAPYYKWVHVRGCSLLGGAGAAGAAPDLLLDKGLRLRALPDELVPHT